jgi:hypothetical protein
VVVRGQLTAPTALSLGKSPQYAVSMKLVGLLSRSGNSDGRNKIRVPAGIEPRSSRPLLVLATLQFACVF